MGIWIHRDLKERDEDVLQQVLEVFYYALRFVDVVQPGDLQKNRAITVIDAYTRWHRVLHASINQRNPYTYLQNGHLICFDIPVSLGPCEYLRELAMVWRHIHYLNQPDDIIRGQLVLHNPSCQDVPLIAFPAIDGDAVLSMLVFASL